MRSVRQPRPRRVSETFKHSLQAVTGITPAGDHALFAFSVTSLVTGPSYANATAAAVDADRRADPKWITVGMQ